MRRPTCRVVGAEFNCRQRRISNGLVAFEYTHFGVIDAVRVIAVQAEADHVLRQFGVGVVLIPDAVGPGGNVQTLAQLQIVKAELDVGFFQRHIGAALQIGHVLERVIFRLTIDSDAHQVERIRIVRSRLAVNALDVQAFVVFQHCELVIQNGDFHPRGIGFDKAGVGDIARLHITHAFVFHLLVIQPQFLLHFLHGAARA